MSNRELAARRRGRWLVGVLGIAFAVVTFCAPADASSDCIDSVGGPGHYNGTSADDAGCVTAAEYAALTSPDGLVDAGVWTSYTDNGDGTVSGIDAATGVVVNVAADPFERPLAATPRLEPDAPTIRTFWYPATAHRLEAMV